MNLESDHCGIICSRVACTCECTSMNICVMCFFVFVSILDRRHDQTELEHASLFAVAGTDTHGADAAAEAKADLKSALSDRISVLRCFQLSQQ